MSAKHLVIDYKITLTLDVTLTGRLSETAVLEKLNTEVSQAIWALGRVGLAQQTGVEDLTRHVKLQSQDRELLRSEEGAERILSRNLETIRSEKDL
jgi:hypothetical protein